MAAAPLLAMVAFVVPGCGSDAAVDQSHAAVSEAGARQPFAQTPGPTVSDSPAAASPETVGGFYPTTEGLAATVGKGF
jgi:hypothetical protein